MQSLGLVTTELYRRLKLPVFDGVQEALESTVFKERENSCKEEEDSIESAKNLGGSGTYQVVKETWP